VRSIRFAALLLVVTLVGCAGMSAEPSKGRAEGNPYVGVFTGEYVDDLPLYRLPSIRVVGSRSAAGDL
jgi:hypothetical protein